MQIYFIGEPMLREKPAFSNGKLSYLESPAKIRIINLGPKINTGGVDYAPQVSPDGKKLYFVSDRKGSKRFIPSEERPVSKETHDLWTVSFFDNSNSASGGPVSVDRFNKNDDQGINTRRNEGAASFSPDGNRMFFTVCNRREVYGKCDIFMSVRRADGVWAKPVNLGKSVNTEYWESTPSISPDGRRLFFISDRPRSPGSLYSYLFEQDNNIWYSDLDPATGIWRPARLLKELSSKGKEMAPCILADGNTMIFSSNGLPGSHGGYDFYVSTYNPGRGLWGTPRNLGKPFNTSNDDQFISVTADRKIILFSSGRKDLRVHQGKLDIYMAFLPSTPELPEIPTPVKVPAKRETIVPEKVEAPKLPEAPAEPRPEPDEYEPGPGVREKPVQPAIAPAVPVIPKQADSVKKAAPQKAPQPKKSDTKINAEVRKLQPPTAVFGKDSLQGLVAAVQLPRPMRLSVMIYDILGGRVRIIEGKKGRKGDNRIAVSVEGLPEGAYLLNLEANGKLIAGQRIVLAY